MYVKIDINEQMSRAVVGECGLHASLKYGLCCSCELAVTAKVIP